MSSSDPATWRKSPYCESGACVELAQVPGEILLRDSKDPDGPVLRFGRAEFDALRRAIKEGEIDDGSN